MRWTERSTSAGSTNTPWDSPGRPSTEVSPTTPGRELRDFLAHLLYSTVLGVVGAAAFIAVVSAQTLDFDTSGLPQPPTTFEEQLLWEDVRAARSNPTFAARAHAKLASYYENKGLNTLAARERAAAGIGGPPAPAPVVSLPPVQPAPPAQPVAVPQLVPPEQPVQPIEAEQALDPSAFDLSGLPAAATNFEEQLIFDSLRDPNTLSTPGLLAFVHRQLGRYYAAQGRADLAAGEYARAVLAEPSDPRGYAGLAALSEAVGVEAGDGTVGLREVSEQLQANGWPAAGPAEPEPEVAVQQDPGAWQEVSAEFNRRMNYLYTSNAWSNVSRTVFTNLYGR
jgi:hypothetical protein